MKKNKVLKIVLIVLGALVVLLAAAVLGVLFYLHSMAAGLPETLPDAPADSTQLTLTDEDLDKLLSGEIAGRTDQRSRCVQQWGTGSISQCSAGGRGRCFGPGRFFCFFGERCLPDGERQYRFLRQAGECRYSQFRYRKTGVLFQ